MTSARFVGGVLLVAVLGVAAGVRPAHSDEPTPVGRWTTVDDNLGISLFGRTQTWIRAR